MHVEWNWKTIVIAAATALLFVGTNVGQYYAIWKPKQEKTRTEYEGRIASLQQTIDAIGPMVDIWTIREGAALFPGKEIAYEDLETRRIPESLLVPSLVLEPETVVGKFYRVSLAAGTPLSLDLVMEEQVDDTTREYDVVADILPIGMRVGDYIDYRIVYPYGEDYIVLPHKRIEAINQKTIKLTLNEREIHFYQAALIDYFLNSDKGATLYLTKYLEPGIQKPATPYYAIPKNIQAIMLADPNILERLNEQINDPLRSMIDTGISAVTEDKGSKISSGRNEIEGVIEGGADAAAQREQEVLEALASEASEIQQSSPPAVDGQTPAETGQSLNIEKGVVE